MAVRISPSLVLTYKQCPRRVKFYLNGEKTEEQYHLTLGRKFHNDVDIFFDKVDVDKLIKFDNNLNEINTYLRSLLPFGTEYDNLLDSFATLEAKRWCSFKDKSYYLPILRERKIVNKKLKISGIVDRVDKLENGEYVVIDYKTGKFHSFAVSSLRFQLSVYATLIDKSNILEKPIKYICGYFPREMPPNNIFFEQKKPQTVKAMWKKIDKTREGIENKMFDKNIGFLCDYCPYCKICLGDELSTVSEEFP